MERKRFGVVDGQIAIASEPEHAYLLENTVLFGECVCRSCKDMLDMQIGLDVSTLAEQPFSSPYRIVLYATFFGKISGQYAISLAEKTALSLIGEYDFEASAEYVRNLRPTFSGLLMELLNVSAGRALLDLQSTFGRLTVLPPTVVYGEIQFPPIRSASVRITSSFGDMLCSCSLDLAKVALGREIDAARKKLTLLNESQDAMLVKPRDLPNARFQAMYKALAEAGGDFYDVVEISSEKYAYFLADASGHDIATSFVTAQLRALLRQNCYGDKAPIDSMRMVNNVLGGLLGAFDYVTAWYLVLDRKKGVLQAIGMGHPPFLFVPHAGEARLIEGGGVMLGAFPDADFPILEMPVQPGDRIYLYSDGLVEGNGNIMWSEGAQMLLSDIEQLRSLQLADAIISLCEIAFPEGTTPRDDIVILGIEV
ncbi:MAG: SpoIIE family protein phosphatase [Chitinivibrionales bacterium]|nr:SpoIIE family protein phosphatase [Chitinivibrionales bacterium]MBD3358937.1 SpoIIE family protein phosphatase [Chitinivibrionales bacterium]